MPKIKKFLLPLVALLLLGFVIYNVTPPKSIYDANPLQIIAFFGPLFLFIYSTVQLVTKLWKRSLIISTGFILLVAVYLLDFGILPNLLIILVAGALFRYTKKPDPYQIPRRIPKLSRLEKQK